MNVFTFVLFGLLATVFGQRDMAKDLELRDDITWKVVGGSQAAASQFPYIVSLRRNNRHFCGGAILNEHWVVTAAHCMAGLYEGSFMVVAGTNTLSAGGIAHPVEEIEVHPNYQAAIHKNDIALVKVAVPFQFSGAIAPIQLGQVGGGADAVLSGWGSTSLGSRTPNNLQYLMMKTVHNCPAYMPEVDEASQICTFLAAGQGACHGDSGGPLASNGLLIGVVSYGRPCARGVPDVFTRVAHFKDWIRGYTQ